MGWNFWGGTSGGGTMQVAPAPGGLQRCCIPSKGMQNNCCLHAWEDFKDAFMAHQRGCVIHVLYRDRATVNPLLITRSCASQRRCIAGICRGKGRTCHQGQSSLQAEARSKARRPRLATPWSSLVAQAVHPPWDCHEKGCWGTLTADSRHRAGHSQYVLVPQRSCGQCHSKHG